MKLIAQALSMRGRNGSVLLIASLLAGGHLPPIFGSWQFRGIATIAV